MRARDKIIIGAKIAASRLTGVPRPFFVQYSLLNGCNAKCAYCRSPERADDQLSTEQHLRILRDLARLGAVRIKFLGGEPFLRKDLERLVDETRRVGMRAAAVTNGFLVPQQMQVVKKLDELIISIDGNQDAHDAQRGRGTWRLVMRAIEACAEAQIDFFLSAVVTRKSADQIDWLIETARKYGVSVNFQIPQFNVEVYGEGARDMMPTPDDIRDILRRVIAAKEAGAPVLFTTDSYRRTLAWDDYAVERIERPGEASPCMAGRYFLQIEPNGDVYPCVLNIGTFQPLNAVRDGIEAAWRHASRHSCFDCYNTWLNENKAIFDLKPAVLANFWRGYLARPPRPTGEKQPLDLPVL